MPIVQILLGALIASGLVLVAKWFTSSTRDGATTGAPNPVDVLIGLVTNFFDTLGIGSFATTTAAFRLLNRVPDELIPGTMLIGHSLPVIAQALIFITVVEVDPAQMAT